ncbi:MAG: NAD-dependent epimerase/dehydratase family protein [Dehalococcoidales bacterium]|nr:NAD-dependent epimerase/dehydratase family protein [Dehalococcoidales bacterium]
MQNVAITGVSGYLGTQLLKRINREPEVKRIIGLDVKEPSFTSPKFTFIKHDVRQPMDGIFRDNKIDTALHLAFIVLPIHDAVKSEAINIGGSKNFLAACAAAGVKQAYYMGSNTEYGAHKDNPPLFTEETPLHPNADYPYACDKARVDRLFQDFAQKHKDVCVTIGRTAPVTGPCGDACGLTALFLPVMVRAVGKNPLWQFIHEDDLVELTVLLLKKKKAGIYNLTGDGALPYRDMIKKLGRPSISLPAWLLHLGIQLSWGLHLQKRSQAGGIMMLQYPIVLDNTKVKKATGYQLRYTGPAAFDEFLRSIKK